jgi:hypothetical protein
MVIATVDVTVETRTRVAFAVARAAFVVCRVVGLTRHEASNVATRVAFRLSSYRIGNSGKWRRFKELR